MNSTLAKTIDMYLNLKKLGIYFDEYQTRNIIIKELSGEILQILSTLDIKEDFRLRFNVDYNSAHSQNDIIQELDLLSNTNVDVDLFSNSIPHTDSYILSDPVAEKREKLNIISNSSIDIDTTYTEKIKKTEIKHSKRERIRSIYVKEKFIPESNIADMLMQFVKIVGIEAVYNLKLSLYGGYLVDKKIIKKYETTTKYLGNGYYLFTNTPTEKKIKQMETIAKKLNLEIHIDTYYR